MKFFTALFTAIILSACQIQGSDLQGNLLNDGFMNVQVPTVETTRTKIEMTLNTGTSLVSFPFLSESDANLLENYPQIESVWQQEGVEVNTVNSESSYFVKALEPVTIEWRKAEETRYNSTLIDSGIYYPALVRGEDSLLASDIAVNSLSISEAYDNEIISSFVVTTENGVIDLVQNYNPDTVILFGGGSVIEGNIFAKVSWPYSSIIQAEVDKEEAKKQEALNEIQKKAEREQEKYQESIEKRLEAQEKERAELIYKETYTLPESFINALKGNPEEIFADRQLLAQVHAFQDIQNHANQLDVLAWKNRDDLLRSFKIIKTEDLTNLSTNHRALLFLQYPLNEEEIDISSGKDSYFKALAFIRVKDCSWKFDPLTTLSVNNVLDSQNNLYTQKHVLDFIETRDWNLETNSDFNNARFACEPSIGSLEDRYNNNLVEIDNNKEIAIVSDEYKNNCEDFFQKVEKVKIDQDWVYNKKEIALNSVESPNISFDVNECYSWAEAITNKEENITDEQVILFAGGYKYRDCKDEKMSDICYLGESIARESITPCKKIDNASLQGICAYNVAITKGKYSMCENVYGRDDENKLMKENCHLKLLEEIGATKEDCSPMKKPFLFFFSLSTERSKACETFIK